MTGAKSGKLHRRRTTCRSSALLFLIPFYVWYAIRQGLENDKLIAILEGDAQAAKTKYRKTQPWDPKWDREVHTWPYLMRMEFLVAIIITILLMVWSLTLNAPLEEPSNPNVTMNPAKAPWYFLGLQEMLVYFDPWMAGVVMPTLIIVGLMVDSVHRRESSRQRLLHLQAAQFSIWTFLVGFIGLWVLMIVIGTFIRGPGWMWFWPGQTWDAERVDYAVNRNLDQVFGIDGSWLAAMTHMSKDQAAIWARVFSGFSRRCCFSSWPHFWCTGSACARNLRERCTSA